MTTAPSFSSFGSRPRIGLREAVGAHRNSSPRPSTRSRPHKSTVLPADRGGAPVLRIVLDIFPNPFQFLIVVDDVFVVIALPDGFFGRAANFVDAFCRHRLECAD